MFFRIRPDPPWACRRLEGTRGRRLAENLECIGQTLRISGTTALSTLNGLVNLRRIGWDLALGEVVVNGGTCDGNWDIACSDNTALVSLAGLESLERIGGSLVIGLSSLAHRRASSARATAR
ncbi:MAG: hypothetical protein PHU25_14705 [Deltaproteobacteria bacterium]|nr:hypothetical protein [Deltaproteobacteria bacterium]